MTPKTKPNKSTITITLTVPDTHMIAQQDLDDLFHHFNEFLTNIYDPNCDIVELFTITHKVKRG